MLLQSQDKDLDKVRKWIGKEWGEIGEEVTDMTEEDPA